ncbi:hypothetical protein ACHAQA_003157 [Verticillium albo-atrum]
MAAGPHAGPSQVPGLHRQNATLGNPLPLRQIDSSSSLYPSQPNPGSVEAPELSSLAAALPNVSAVASKKRKRETSTVDTQPDTPSAFSSPLPTSTPPTDIQPSKKTRIIFRKTALARRHSESDVDTTVSTWLGAHPENPEGYVDVDSPTRSKPKLTLVACNKPDARPSDTTRSAVLGAIETVRCVEETLKLGFLPGSKYPTYHRHSKPLN